MSDWSIGVVHVLCGGQCAQRRLHTTFLVELLALIFEVIKTRILLLHEACMASERDLEIKVQLFLSVLVAFTGQVQMKVYGKRIKRNVLSIGADTCHLF